MNFQMLAKKTKNLNSYNKLRRKFSLIMKKKTKKIVFVKLEINLLI